MTRQTKSDGASDGVRRPQKRFVQKAVAMQTRDRYSRDGAYSAYEWAQGVNGPRRKRVVLGNVNPNITSNPAHRIFWQVQRALDPHSVRMTNRQPVTIYDASGKPIATVDPNTRERKPL